MAMVIHQPQPGTQTSNDQFPVSATRTYPSASAQYEEVVQTSELFHEKLRAFHASFGTKFILEKRGFFYQLSYFQHFPRWRSSSLVPTVGGKALDLHRLFVEVTSRGGMEKVIKDRRWKDVVLAFSFPTTITSASFVLRKYYMALVYHFEQVYYFSKQMPSYLPSDFGTRVDDGSVSRDDSESMSHSLENMKMQAGCSVRGTIDGKFDSGYLVTINMGSEDLKGVVYHIPAVMHMSQGQEEEEEASTSRYFSSVTPRRGRKRSRLASRDPSQPKSNRNGYNFFFAEHYARLKPQYPGQEKTMVKKIGHLWNNLTDAEKQVYQEKGATDKERYKREMLNYRSSQHHHPEERLM